MKKREISCPFHRKLLIRNNRFMGVSKPPFFTFFMKRPTSLTSQSRPEKDWGARGGEPDLVPGGVGFEGGGPVLEVGAGFNFVGLAGNGVKGYLCAVAFFEEK